MVSPGNHAILDEIVSLFETLATKLEHAIEAFAQHESGTVNLAALHQAKEVAQRGTNIVRRAKAEVRSAFD